MVERYATNGGLMFFQVDGQDSAVVILNTRLSCLIALNIRPMHRGHGLGAAILDMLMPNFIRSTEKAVPYFRKFDYVPIGELKPGYSLNTQILVREKLITLAGRIRRIFEIEDAMVQE